MEIKYIAFDGREFSDASECVTWEDQNTPIIDRRISDKFNGQPYYYLASSRQLDDGFAVHRVYLIDIEERHDIEYAQDEDGNVTRTKVLENTFIFRSIDVPDEEPFCAWKHEQLPVRRSQDLFPFNLRMEIDRDLKKRV